MSQRIIHVEQHPGDDNDRPIYIVVKTTNTTEPRLGQVLSKIQVDSFCRKAIYTVHVVPPPRERGPRLGSVPIDVAGGPA